MTSWRCTNCGVDCEDVFDVCWNCGAGRDGSPPPDDFVRDDVDPDQAHARRLRKLKCQRCDRPMHFIGTKRFHEGGPVASMLRGDWLLNREEYDVYACRGCGKLEFFLDVIR